MSRKQQALLLSAPLFGDIHRKEREEFSGFTCSYCTGNGWFWKEDNQGERCKENCKTCGGSGRLKAVVTVEWKAEK